MARPLRIEYPGAWYHVMNRGQARRDVFLEPGDGQGFLAVLAEACDLFGAECHAYCLMPNHYHLLLHTPHGDLSRVMRQLDGVYTQRFNRRHGRDGPLFRGRYKAILIDADNYLLQVSRYIHRNPVAAGLTPQPETYRWSSYRGYLTPATAPAWLHRDMLLEMIGGPEPAAAYRDYVEAGVDEETGRFFERQRRAPVFGSRDFRERVRAGRRPHPDIPDRRRLIAVPDIDTVLRAVAAAYDVSVEDLARDHRGRDGAARAAAMLLCRRLGGRRLTEIAEALGGCSYSAVSKGVERARRRMATDADFARRVAEIEEEIVDKGVES